MVELKPGEHKRKERGQAMTEYALILVLISVAFGTALALTGPAIGNVFCNVVHNIGGETASPQGGSCGSTAPNLDALGGNPTHFWATVTWVAGNPQGETPFPTPIRRAATSVSGGLLPTATRTHTPTQTFTPSPTFTFTPSQTPSPGPSPTNSDFAFRVPHIDQISKPEWWRLDTGDFMGYTPWEANWYDDIASVTCPSLCDISLQGLVSTDPELTFDINGINYDWGNGFPSGVGITDGDTWGAEFTRTITVAETADYEFTLGANNFGTLYLDGTPFLSHQANDASTSTGRINITEGDHELYLIYAENNVNATVSLSVRRLTVNVDDVTTGSNECTWGQTSGATVPVSISFMFENNPGSTAWPGGQTCNLELRGYVDLTGNAHPMLSFWDIWDFTGAGNVTAVLQVSRYVQDVNGFLDRAQLSWQTVATHSAGTSNYAWTRNQVDLKSIAGLTEKVTFRFVIGSSGGASNNFRWYLDDLEIINDPTPTSTFTVGKTWDLNNRIQMRDFIYDGDFDKLIEDNISTYVPDTREQSRWDLTNTNAHSGSGWDDSPGYNYQQFPGLSGSTPPTRPRIHPLELHYPVSLSSAPAADAEGDTGVPLLSFWHAYDIRLDSSIRVEYTRDANDMVPDTWTTIPNQGMLIDYAIPSVTGRTNLAMQPVEIDLTNILNWNTQPFRLRFALYVGETATTFGEGWYIDDIKIERQSASPYFAYPFIDHADDATFADAAWDLVGGRWGQTTEKGSAANTDTFAYSDSPSAQYDPSDVQMLQLHFAVDLLNDTPENLEPAGRAPAVNPILTFWHQRTINGGTFNVEMWTAATNTWTSVWQYNSATDTTFKTQQAWEPVEINLLTALQTITGSTWTTISSNGVTNDDDIRIRFNFTTPAGPAADGVYVDEISIDETPILKHRLWTGGDGTYKDFIESINVSAGLSFDSWQERWREGGTWNETSASGYSHSGSFSLADSPLGDYSNNTFNVLEMVPTIDLTSTVATDKPAMYFWTRFMIGSDDTFRVEIATRENADTTQGYNKIGGWSAWSARPMMVGSSVSAAGSDTLTNTGVVTWERGAVDLTSFIGKEIRVRFVLSVPNSTNQADGIFIDDVQFDLAPPQLTMTFTDNAQTTTNWVKEGTWDLGQNYFFGRGTNDLDFGATLWSGTFFDCEQLKAAATCNLTTTYTSILDENANLAPSATFDPTGPIVGPENVTEVNHNYGTDRPLGNSTSVSEYSDTWAARWNRDVTLSPGTYSISVVLKDSARLIIDDVTGTDIAVNGTLGGNRGFIVNDWGNTGTRLAYGTFTVSANITPTLSLEFFHTTGDAIIILNMTKNSFSFTDSPNPPNGSGGFTLTNSVYPGNSSLLLNGFFNLLPTSAHPTPSLTYQRLYDLKVNSFFYVEISTDGGFTWSTVTSETLTGPTSLLPPQGYWDEQVVPLAAPTDYRSANTMVRFRLDTRTATAASGGTGDGIYLAEIVVRP